MKIPELCNRPALEQQRLVARGQISCVELLEEHLAWIAAVNPRVNAICTLVPEPAREAARAADARLASGEAPRPLEGLPIAIKDLVETAGIRTTFGSPLFRDHVPAVDVLHVQRLKAAGAVVIGKTNTPEWGAGSQTFNTLFGATATPYDLACTAGGSSGGAAAALAARMLPIADGSDLGGSLRNPASFCNVVGLRPTPGRVPNVPERTAWNPLSVLGPMARTVADAALLLSVMAGADPRAPLSLGDDPRTFARDLERDAAGMRIAWTADLGFLPVSAEVRTVTATAPEVFAGLGCEVSAAAPDLQDAPEVFQTLRACLFAARFGEIYRAHPEMFKDTVQWNVERGLALSGEAVGRAELAHTRIFQRMLKFFERHDFLILPSTQVAPFDKQIEWIREIEGVQFDNYLQWMEICSLITLTGCPAISVPCGFTPRGLPVGLQIVGRPGADFELLQIAQAFETATDHAVALPELE